VRAEPFEFTSNGGGGEALPRRVKRRTATFYEVIKIRIMERKKAFEPGDIISTFTRQVGIVISQEVYGKIQNTLKEKKRPGHYFAPGCCQHPDYITQIPVLFEDGKYDVMRPMNIRKALALPVDKKVRIQGIIDEQMG